MASSLPNCGSARVERRPRGWLARVVLLCALALCALAQAARGAELQELRVERTVAGLFLYAQLDFELSPSIEDALEKGIPVYFVADARVMRKRWYWYDEELSHAERHWRLAYQPLTRQWRLNTSSEPISGDQLGVGLTRYHDSLAEALASIQRIAGWKVATLAQVSGGGPQFLQFDFQLDPSQLPRTFLLGRVGEREWHIAISRRLDLTQEDGQ